MKKIFALVLLALMIPSFVGCAGCGCHERLRNCFRRGAICGTRTAPVATAPAPIVYAQPAPVQQYVQPQYAQPQFVQPQPPAPIVQAPAPRVMPPQYAAPTQQCCPCVPCCPPVYQDCCPDPCGCSDGSYSVGSPVYEGGWMSGAGCCDGSTQGSYDGGFYDGPATIEPSPTRAAPATPENQDPGPDPST